MTLARKRGRPSTSQGWLPEDTAIEEELRLAEIVVTEAALDRMDTIAADLGVDPSVVDRMRTEYAKHLAVLHAHGHDDDPGRRAEGDFRRLRLALIGCKRDAVIALRDGHLVDDIVLRQILAHLDTEEIRLSRRDLAD